MTFGGGGPSKTNSSLLVVTFGAAASVEVARRLIAGKAARELEAAASGRRSACTDRGSMAVASTELVEMFTRTSKLAGEKGREYFGSPNGIRIARTVLQTHS